MNLDNYIKTILSGVRTWAQSTFAKKSDIKDMYHSETKIETLVDNLTSEDYSNGNIPACNFIDGESYDVIWNGTLYEGLVCHFDGSYNIIATPDQGYPFYIDDDGGGGLYIQSDESEFTVSIIVKSEIVHTIDPKYLPEMETPLASESKAGAVHPWINSEYGQNVWMHPETGELFTYNYVLPIASNYVLGGVMPVSKTSDMTQNVGVDSYGRLYTMPSAQADWNETNISSAAYIKNKPIQVQADWNEKDDVSAAYIKNKPRVGSDYLILSDKETDSRYAVSISEGNIVTSEIDDIDYIKIVNMPDKRNYMYGDQIDVTGMSVSAIYKSGEEKSLIDYSITPDFVTSYNTSIKVMYEEYGKTATCEIPITVSSFDPSVALIDFTYTTNSDNTYTITGWKGTNCGATSTELIIPSNLLIKL